MLNFCTIPECNCGLPKSPTSNNSNAYGSLEKFIETEIKMSDGKDEYTLVWNEQTQAYDKVPVLPEQKSPAYISDVKHECKCPFIRLLIVHSESCANDRKP